MLVACDRSVSGCALEMYRIGAVLCDWGSVGDVCDDCMTRDDDGCSQLRGLKMVVFHFHSVNVVEYGNATFCIHVIDGYI